MPFVVDVVSEVMERVAGSIGDDSVESRRGVAGQMPRPLRPSEVFLPAGRGVELGRSVPDSEDDPMVVCKSAAASYDQGVPVRFAKVQHVQYANLHSQ